jgi:hypothetical protein
MHIAERTMSQMPQYLPLRYHELDDDESSDGDNKLVSIEDELWLAELSAQADEFLLR